MSAGDVDRAIDGYEAAVQRQLIDMARSAAARLVRLRAHVEALGGFAGNERDRGYNEAVINAVALIDRALAGEEM